MICNENLLDNASNNDAIKQMEILIDSEPSVNFHLDNLRELFVSYIKNQDNVPHEHLSDICFTFEALSDQLSLMAKK